MTEITPNVETDRTRVFIEWRNIGSGDTVTAIDISQFSDKTVHVFGTFDGSTINMLGSNDTSKTEWFPLVDPQGTAISFSSNGGEVILENTRFIKPDPASLGASTDITVAICAKRSV